MTLVAASARVARRHSRLGTRVSPPASLEPNPCRPAVFLTVPALRRTTISNSTSTQLYYQGQAQENSNSEIYAYQLLNNSRVWNLTTSKSQNRYQILRALSFARKPRCSKSLPQMAQPFNQLSNDLQSHTLSSILLLAEPEI